MRDVAGELSGGGVRPRSGIDTAKTRLSFPWQGLYTKSRDETAGYLDLK